MINSNLAFQKIKLL